MLCPLFIILSLGSLVAGQQDFLSALSAQSSLTIFTSLIRNYSSLLDIAQAGNVTVLAPSDTALTSFLNTSTTTANYSSTDQLGALLSYHFLKGVHSQASISSTPQFIPTLLTNSSYTNVTTGQVVEAVSNSSTIGFESAVNRVSRLVGPVNDIVFYGGLVHIIDAVLIPPYNVDETVTEAPLPYFIQLIAGVLNPQYLPILQNITDIADSTFFAVNSPDTQATAASNTTTLQQTVDGAEYDIIPGQILYSPALTNGSSFTTALGVNVTITILNNSTYVNDAKITWSNILVANGVLHVIDKILNASDANARPQVNVSTPLSTPAPTPAASPGHLSTGALAGIGIGVALFVLAIGGLVFIIRKRRANAISKPALHEYLPEMGTHTRDGQELDSKNLGPPELEANAPPQELEGTRLDDTLPHQEC